MLPAEARAQGLRYIAVGCLVAGLYFVITAGLSELAGLPFQLAMLVGYSTALTVHFVLHRSYTFTTEQGYALSASHQAGRYVTFAVAQYLVVAGAVALGTSLFDVSPLLIWLAIVTPLIAVSFLLLRTRMFHSRSENPSVGA